MQQEKDLLTVIVPTRERPDTLLHCLRTITEQKDPRLEIIVSDNCSGPETKAVVDSFDDPRLRYIRPAERLGMSEHWDFALNHAAGNWVTFIGDDDGLLPDAVATFFSLIEGKDVKAVGTSQCKFWWSNPEQHRASKLTVQLGSDVEMRSTKKWLARVLNAKENFQTLPYIYTGGFIRADLIAEIKSKSGGTFFHSITPDAYSGIAACLMTDTYLYSWRPLALAGISRHSNGQAQMTWTEKDHKKIDFFSESSIGFHPKLGNGVVQSVPMIIYEAFLRAQHLEKESMGVTMEDQLALSIVYAEKARRDDVLEYCKAVAAQNGIAYGKIKKKLAGLKVKKRAAKITKNIMRQIVPTGEANNKKVIGDPGLNTIYDASRRSDEIIHHAR
ncbi:MAG: glycosyltransferase [Alphaproteobacteria bacterium]|nr:glycosyltransferase [Alphaproteobacteria bacterium]